MLSFAQLAIVALLAGVGTVFFEISYQSYVPVIVAIADLPRANARLEFTRSVAQIAGNGVAGLLISLIGAARAVALDASSFVVSIVSLLLIGTRETNAATGPSERATIVGDVREGLAFVFGSPVLRSIAGCTATSNVGASMLSAVLLVFAYRDLHLKAVTVGLIFAFANVGFIGALLATKCASRFGVGRTLATSIFIGCAAPLLLPLARLGMPIVVLYVVELLTTIAVPIYNINQISLRQTLVPPALQGRMNATIRTIVWGVMPLGALLGGVLGSAIGVLPTIVVAGLIGTSAVLWIVATPAGRVRSIAAELSA
jgi:hypothetical protein